MTKLYFTRHGQTQWNLEGKMQGHQDSALTELGIKQAIWLGEKLETEHIDIIISSSSGRAYHTAEIICGNRDIEIIKRDDLKEIHLGEWEGLHHTEVEEKYSEQHHNFWKAPHLYEPHGGETYQEFMDRVTEAVKEIVHTYEGKNILLVGHAVVMKSILAYIGDKQIKDIWSGAFMHSTCLSIAEFKEEGIELVLEGDTSHYKEDIDKH